ncbi:MAG: ABC transporter permease subunit [Clostridia bacterium]|nr:ABC transporter permease subunit [Clostridia bacterium]
MKNKTFISLKYALLIYLAVTVLLPIIVLFSRIRGSSIKEVFTSVQFLPMLKNSLITTVIATLISTVLSFGLAFALSRSNVKLKALWVILFSLPMLLPSISHGTGVVLLFGDNGIVTNLLGINIGVYGYTGIIIGSVLYSFPVSFLLFYDSFQYEDYTIYESASVLGFSKWRQFLKITLPSMKGTIVSAVIAVFTMVFTDYGVALICGGTEMTLPVYMYREVIGLMNFSSGAVVGVVLLMPAIIAFLLDLRKSNAGSNSTVTRGYMISKNKTRDALVYAAFAVTVFLLCLPIVAFAFQGFVKQYPMDKTFSWEHVKKLFSSGMGSYLMNSIAIALLTSLLGTVLSYFAAYITARMGKQIPNKVLHFISLLSLAIPGVVLGLSFVLTFNDTPLYSTIFILVIVNIVHFFSSPYLLAYNSLSKFNSNLEDVAATLGISKMKMLTAVYIPSTMLTIVEMYAYYFVNAMITISAVSFLVNFRTTTLSLMIPQLESQSFIEGTAIVSLMILAINLLVKGLTFLVKQYIIILEKRNRRTHEEGEKENIDVKQERI